MRSFLAALDHGSLLGAARALGASQPTLGRHIAELEVAAGRGAVRAHRPRPAADRRWRCGWRNRRARWRPARDQLARSVSGARGRRVRHGAHHRQPAGGLRAAAAGAGADAQALPEVQVELVSSNEVSNLLRREADIALRMVQPDQASLVARRIGKVTLGAYAHRDYLRRRGTPRQPPTCCSTT